MHRQCSLSGVGKGLLAIVSTPFTEVGRRLMFNNGLCGYCTIISCDDS